MSYVDQIMAEVATREANYELEREIENIDINCELREFAERNWFDESY